MSAEGMRKAALTMATLHPTDRRWMLARLPRAWRPMLEPLIGEALRFVSLDADALQAVLHGQGDGSGAEVPTPAVLIAVLDTLSSQWAACVLVAAAADHVEVYLAACDRHRADAIRLAMGRLRHPFPDALAGSIARCLHEAGKTLSSAVVQR